MDLFRNGTDKTGTGQVPFTRQISSEPFVFLSEPFQFFGRVNGPLFAQDLDQRGKLKSLERRTHQVLINSEKFYQLFTFF